MSDDLREREPLRDRADLPAEDGIRSDHAGAASPDGAGAAPAGGGYGSPSGRGSGGTGEARERAGDEAETDWLRSEATGGADAEPVPAAPGTAGVTTTDPARIQPENEADW